MDTRTDTSRKAPIMGRRQYGTGTVYRRDDGRWIGRAEAGWTSKGTRRRVSVSGKTEAEAKRKLRDKLRTIHEDEAQLAGRKLTVKQWADEWLPLHAARVRPGHHTTTASLVRVWIVPTLGGVKLEALAPAHARKLERAILSAGRSESLARAADSALRTMLKDARIEGHKVPEGIRIMARPAVTDSERDAIPTADALAILRAADGTPELPRWVLALLQGIRQAEATGLTWDRVDLDAGTIDISWQLKHVKRGAVIPARYEHRHIHGTYHLMRPKTEAGRRIVPLSPPAIAALTAWKQVAPDNPWGLVFPDRDGRHGQGGAPIPRSSIADREAWYALQRAAGVSRDDGSLWKVHEARHTAATLMLAAGIDPALIAAVLGQKRLVQSYVHLQAEHSRPAVDALAGVLDWKSAPGDETGSTISA